MIYKPNFDNSLFEISQWYSVTFFFKKMISIKTCYKTYNGKNLAIFKAFKT